jgi:hypothetical protein
MVGSRPMDQKVLLEERNVRVTDKTLTIGDKAFSIRAISAVRYKEFKPSIVLAVGCLLPGLLMLAWGVLAILLSGLSNSNAEELGSLLAIGLMCILGGLYFLGRRAKPYSIFISGAGMTTDTAVLSDSNKHFVKRVHRALNQAIEESAS